MTLSGYHICFTGFYDEEDDECGDENKNHTYIQEKGTTTTIPQGGINISWTLRRIRSFAESLGAVVQTQITRRTTVLVAGQGLTRKRLVAEQHRIPVVSPRWLESHGRIAFADAKLLPLAGYTFCATQMTKDEEKALISIVERHGGDFDRTLTAQTSMLFVPPGWFKQWQQQQQRLSGRLSTGPQGSVSSPALPEKIRFAWATDIPVVEYTRFLTMAALGTSVSTMDDNNNNNNNNNNNEMSMKASSRTDFDTIAQLCALPISIVGGAVPHTQRDNAVLPNTTVAEKITKTKPQERGTVAIVDNSDNDEGDGKNKSDTKQVTSVKKDVLIVKHETNTLQDAHYGNQDTNTLCCSLQEEKGITAVNPSGHPSANGALSINNNNNNNNNNNKSFEENENHFFFTQSHPFLQVALLGCTARELVECIRMAVSCRFLRTCIVTPLTDVVVVGSELLQLSPEGMNKGITTTNSGNNTHQQQQQGYQRQQQGQVLAQLRDHLCSCYGVPVERIVTIAWLHTCYQRMMLLHASHNVDTTIVNSSGVTRNTSFFPLPLPLNEVPPTEQFNLRITSTVSLFEAPKQQQQQQEQQQQSEVPLPRPRKKKTSASESLQSNSKKSRLEVVAPDTLNDAEKQYNAELHLAERRVKDLLELLSTSSSNIDEDSLPPLISCLFCFMENDFSRIELAVVRALIKHGKGIWMKKTRDEWTKALTRTGTTVETTTMEEEDEKKQQAERELLDFVRRRSVFHKRLSRAQIDGDAAVTHYHIQSDTGHSRKLSPLLPEASGAIIALYVVPHGDQRPSNILLRNDGKRSNGSQWHPLRYLPAVTQDYVLCCLAAQRMLHPSSCFIFYQPVPTENERLARRRLRCEAGKPLTISPWLGQRRHEKAPLVGVSVYFLCIMEDEVCTAATTLRRVLVSCLAAAVSELGGHTAEVLLQEAVTHIVIVDIASIMASGPLTENSEILPWSKADQLEEREGLLTRQAIWPKNVPSVLLYELMGIVNTGRISLVGMEWLHASVVWGVFLEETPYTLPITYNNNNNNNNNPIKEEQQQEDDDEEPCNPGRATVAFSTVTPPITPQRRRVGITDVTLLPFESSTKAATATSAVGEISPSSQLVGSGYQFDFTTPNVTPGRPHLPRDLLNSSHLSATRQSCPRSTLRTPQKQRVGVPRVISPSVALVQEAEPIQVLNSPRKSGSEELSKRESVPQMDEDVDINRHACTPIREPHVLGDDDGDYTYSNKKTLNINKHNMDVNNNNNNNNRVSNHNSICHIDDDSDNDTASCTRFSCRSLAGRSSVTALEMPQQWDPDANSNSIRPLHSPSSVSSQIAAEGSSSSSYFNLAGASGAGGDSSSSSSSSGAVRIHILHDVPERDKLVVVCRRLSDSVCSEVDNSDNSTDGHHRSFWHQQRLHHPMDMMTGVITRVQVVERSVQDADVLVTHQLTQRESVLAAVAAGLWVVTPKLLQDCEIRQSFLPFRDLSVYEWCPELLPPGAPRSSMQLSKQCRSRRQQRQATGTRLFDNKCFLLVSPDTTVSLSRMRSMRNVLETGGGFVVSVTYKETDSNKVLQVNPTTRRIGSEERIGEIQRGEGGGGGILLSSPESLLEFVITLIRGKETDGNDEGCDLPSLSSSSSSYYTTSKKRTPLSEKELLILLDGFVQGNDTTGEIQSMVEVFRHAQTKFSEARQHALGNRKYKKHQGQQEHQRDQTQWGFRNPSINGIPNREMLRSIVEMRKPLDSLKCSIPQITFSPPSVNLQEKNNINEGMPCVERVQMFTSDWMTLAIQQRRKVPLCVVPILL
ncbi:BRCT domain [Trypanosoma melophagium]|uniref:BRCT domain n=1 Tax=Trypanosoma melophagium TaxID=715481 RepID=UPI00351A3B5B|nr:BRCT domain [Trypanosoma melophagium]